MAWEPRIGFLGSFGDHQCLKESSNLFPSEGAECMQGCESEGHNLGAIKDIYRHHTFIVMFLFVYIMLQFGQLLISYL